MSPGQPFRPLYFHMMYVLYRLSLSHSFAFALGPATTKVAGILLLHVQALSIPGEYCCFNIALDRARPKVAKLLPLR